MTEYPPPNQLPSPEQFPPPGPPPPPGKFPPPDQLAPPVQSPGPPPLQQHTPPSAPMAPQGQKRPFWKKKRVFIPAGALSLLFVGGAIAGPPEEDPGSPSAQVDTATSDDQEASDSTAEETSANLSETTVAPTTTTAAPPTTATTTSLPTIDAGTYVVGSEISPGLYRVAGYWATLDAAQEIIENEFVNGQGLGLAVIPESARFVEINGEAVAVADLPTIDPIEAGFDSGTYLVGVDIQPGDYRVTGTDRSAYGARLDANLGIIDNSLNDGSVILTIQPSDFAFTFTGTLEALE